MCKTLHLSIPIHYHSVTCVCVCARARAHACKSLSIPKHYNLFYFFCFSADRLQIEDQDNDDFYIVLHKKKMDALISPLLCPTCKHSTLTFKTHDELRRGYAQKVEVVCSRCTYGNIDSSSPQIDTTERQSRKPFEINHRAVLAAREVGIGQREMMRMFAMLNIKGGLHHRTYHRINRQIHNKLLHGPAADTLTTSHSLVHKMYDDIHGRTDGPRDITVSYDGTWYIKGHTSSVGACFVIDQLSGFVLDYVVLSKYCAECTLVGDKLTGKERELWLAAHRQVCECNHTGSSGAMETEGAKILWRRSEEVGGFCYTCLVGDGDAAVMDALSTASPYPVKKEECINHIAKRMFNGLEKIIKDVNSEVKANKMKASGTTSAVKAATLLTTTLSGKGRLTRDRMKKWSSYYRKAIVENAPDADAAHHAVWAIFFHSLSTLDDPHHSFCSDTWCYWRQAQLEGVDPAVKLKQMKHDTPLPRDVSERLIPLFERLANPDLLSRCMKLVTSNANESLHSTFWRRAPKAKYCGKKTTEIAVALAVMSYNKGAGALSDAISSLGVSPGKTLLRVTDQLDALRLRVA